MAFRSPSSSSSSSQQVIRAVQTSTNRKPLAPRNAAQLPTKRLQFDPFCAPSPSSYLRVISPRPQEFLLSLMNREKKSNKSSDQMTRAPLNVKPAEVASPRANHSFSSNGSLYLRRYLFIHNFRPAPHSNPFGIVFESRDSDNEHGPAIARSLL